jgi:protoporphyrinogen oxidase
MQASNDPAAPGATRPSGSGRHRVVVVGAGLTGLVAARALAANGTAVTVVDRNAEVGGLARTLRYGEWSFDIGPHRFRTEDPDVRRVVGPALGDDVLTVRPRPGIHAFGKTHALPLRGLSLRSLLLRAMLHGAWHPMHPGAIEDGSFESEEADARGRPLYEAVFRRTNERLLRTSAHQLDADWEQIDALDADPRGAAPGLYPRRGIGALAERLSHDVVASGGRILLGHEVTGIDVAGSRVTSVTAGGERLAAEAVVWTAPVTRALLLLGIAPPAGLRFVSTVLFNIALREPPTLRHDTVCYAGDERFVRVSDPAAFSPSAAPPGRGGLCVECTCHEGDALWEDPSQHVPQILVGLAHTGAIRSVRSVEAVCPERIPDTFPVYESGYRGDVHSAVAALSRYRNLVLAGRAGLFWCNRMDEAIAHGLRVAASLEGDWAGRDGQELPHVGWTPVVHR